MTGTRSQFRDWLSAVHGLTYTKFLKLSPEKRDELRTAYGKVARVLTTQRQKP